MKKDQPAGASSGDHTQVRLVPGEEVGRVLVEISVTEQRYQAVLAVLGRVPVTDVASRFGGEALVS